MSSLRPNHSPAQPDLAIETAALPSTPPALVRTSERGRASVHATQDRSLCDENHRRMKANEPTWQAAPFGGYQPLGSQLGEIRYCPLCQSSVVRPVTFTAALLDVFEHLLCPQRPSEIYVHSASILASWAQSNVPDQLGIAPEPETYAESAILDPSRFPRDWRQLGLELRMRRESAGLTRHALGTLSGVADSTIRNFETGRHRPRTSTVHRLRAVPEIHLSLSSNQNRRT